MLKGVVEVKSSFIQSIEWKEDTLSVKINGKKYHYEKVTKEDIISLISHETPGSFFNSNIKKVYPLINSN